MIEKMKSVCIVSSLSRKDEMLSGLRKLGVLHISEKKSADQKSIERFSNLSRTINSLMDYAPDKKSKDKKEMPLLSDKDFEEMYEGVRAAFDKKAELGQEKSGLINEVERIRPWGEFDPAELKELKAQGFDLHFYRAGKAELSMIEENTDVSFIRMASVDKMDTIAVMGSLPSGVSAMEFQIPEKSISELEARIEECTAEIEKCDETLKNGALCLNSFNDQLLKAQNEEIYSSASETSQSDEELVWISGYVPADDFDKISQAAKENCWAWAVSDVDDEDDQVPTKVRYNKVSGLIKPVFDILGVLPGYRETDISLWFLLFFTLFFAMIMGDGGYGFLLLIATVAIIAKTKKMNTITYLLLVLSIATIVWGAITGTWFGMESAMKVPFLRALVIPSLANYPEYFGVTALEQQNAIMKFSFTVGAIQMSLGTLIAIKRKISEKNLSWIADLGWLIAIVSMYLLTLLLVIGESIEMVPVFIGIGCAFLLVVLFGGMSPDKTFGQGLKAGLGSAFTVFLDTISCFGNVMSYIRLFAVGMAGLAISQSFNSMASGFTGPLIIAGVVIVIVGHALNIVMCFLSVVVHGVRLNVLEFSGQVGLEWTGLPYEPFKTNEKVVK